LAVGAWAVSELLGVLAPPFHEGWLTAIAGPTVAGHSD